VNKSLQGGAVMLDRSPVMWTRDLTKEAHPAFCSAGTADPGDISSNHIARGDKGVRPPTTPGVLRRR
jgi:hypothetical protein